MARTAPADTARPRSNDSSPQMPHISLVLLAHPALDQRIDRVDAVDPADLLAFVLAPRLVADRHLENAAPRSQHLRGDFRLEIETDAAEPDAVERLTPEHLVRGLHVGEPPPEQHVRQHRQEAVRDPALERDTDRRREKARTVDDVGAAVEDRREQAAVLVRVELEIGVLHEQDVAGGERESEPHGGALSEIDRAVVGLDAGVVDPAALVDRASRAVARSVVGDDHLALEIAEIHFPDALDHLSDRLLFVVDRNDDGQFHRWSGTRGPAIYDT